MTTTPAAGEGTSQAIGDESLVEVLHETSKYLDVVDDQHEYGDPVPRERFVEQAIASGYDRQSVENSLRETTAIVLATDDPTDILLEPADTDGTGDATTDEDAHDATGSVTECYDQEKVRGWFGESFDRSQVPRNYDDRQWSDATTRVKTLMLNPQGTKLAKAPWGVKDNPDADCSGENCPDDAVTTADPRCRCDARYKWTQEANFADFDTASRFMEHCPDMSDSFMVVMQREDDPYLDDADPYMVLDGDDVVDKDGRRHPQWVEIVEDLAMGPTYSSLSSGDYGEHVPLVGALPGDRKQIKIPLDEDVDGWDNSHLAGDDDDDDGDGDGLHVDIFDGKHLRKSTGKKTPDTPLNVARVDTDQLERYADDYGSSLTTTVTETLSDGTLVEREHTVTLTGEYTGPEDALEDIDVPDGECFEYRAILEAHYHGYTTSNFWAITGAAAAWGAYLGKSASEVIDDLRGVDRDGQSVGFGSKTPGRVNYDHSRAQSGAFSKPGRSRLVELGVLPTSFWETESHIPDDPSGSQFVETCTPPTLPAVELDVLKARDDIVTEHYPDVQAATTLSVDIHPAGTGKTTSYSLAASERDHEHVMYLPTHENCREFQRDDAKPDGYYHLKGAAQPRHTACMDAKLEGDGRVCPEHGDTAHCPRMCPAYGETGDGVDGPTEDFKQRFQHIAEHVGVREAHFILNIDDEPWHSDRCPWEQQFGQLESEDRVVTVHNYASLRTVRKKGLQIVDDLQGAFGDTQVMSPATIGLLSERLSTLSRVSDGSVRRQGFKHLGEYCERLRDAVAGQRMDDGDRPLKGLEPPRLETAVGVTNPKHEMIETAKVLSELVRVYYDTTKGRLSTGAWEGEPLDLTPLLAALAESGVPPRACRIAARQPFLLTVCPEDTDHRLVAEDGHKFCPECGWNEIRDDFVGQAYINTPERFVGTVSTDDDGTTDGLEVRTIPRVDQLPAPDDTLILDATPRLDVLMALFGATSDPTTFGHRDYDLPNAHVTQIVDGAYHHSTVAKSGGLQTGGERLQTAVEKIAHVHERPLLIAKKEILSYLDIPENADTRYYGALRGLNETQCDAVVCIGAPHPSEHDIRENARLLALDTDYRAGGTEYSVRDGSPNPPVYTKYRYEDDDGNGYAVAQKTYDGLTGELFHSVREDELEQAAHRIRPILTDDTQTDHIYLLTNVPTELPVDTLTTLQAIDDPLRGALGVGDKPAAFIESIAMNHDLDTFEGTRKDWESAAGDVVGDVGERGVRKWMKALQDEGHVEKVGYTSTGAPEYAPTDAVIAVFRDYEDEE